MPIESARGGRGAVEPGWQAGRTGLHGHASRVPRSLVKAELARILASPAFRTATTHRRLLSHLVTQALSGHGAGLKEAVLGVEVFDRAPGEFDPRGDTIVRVEVRRLRQRLARCYATESHDGQVEISLPVGSYAPVFRRRPLASANAPRAVESGVHKEARELIERGDFLLRQGDQDSYRKALERFEQARSLQPDNALAHLGAARAWSALVGMTFEPATPGIEHARELARRAIECEADQGEAYGLLASIAHRYDYDWRAAEPMFDHAIALAPGSSFLHHALAFSLTMARRFDEAELEYRLARELDPLDPSLRTREAILHLYRHQWSEAECGLRAVLDMTPGAALPLSLLGSVQLCRGEPEAALATYAEVARGTPQLSIGEVGMAQALALAGRRDEALALLAALQQRFDPDKHLSPYQLAMIRWRLGETDAALSQLEAAAQTRDCNFFCLPVDPAFDALRSHPRFEALMRRFVGLA